MEIDDDAAPLTLPDTQNTDSQCLTQSQDTIVNEIKIWGRLCPHTSNFKTIELSNDEYRFGRDPRCEIVATSKTVPNRERLVSKFHFKISREISVSSNGVEDDIIYLHDDSQNGTYINNQLVGKGKKVLLVNNDIIAFAKKHYNVFVYMSTSGYDDSFLPDEVRQKFAVSRTLGSGACGEVKLCFSKSGLTGKKFAMKIISKNKINATMPKNPFNDEKNIMNEVAICKKLKHPCIIRVEEYFNSPSAVYIILELMEGGELFDRIKKYNGLPEKNAKFFFYQIALAVNYLHKNGITHRDLKPENILLASDAEETIVKISDFGLSKFVDSQTMMKTFCGTPMYVAPEILKGGKSSYTSQVDVWSLGVILYCCLSGLTPFRINDKHTVLYEQIIKGLYNFNSPKFSNISFNAKDLIRKMMTVDPLKRITIQKVLEHPWFQDYEMLAKIHNLLDLTNNENMLKQRVEVIMSPNTKIAKRPRHK